MGPAPVRAQTKPTEPLPPVTSELLKEGDVLVTSADSRAKVIGLGWANGQRCALLERTGANFGWECWLPLAQLELYLREGRWKNLRTTGWKGRRP